MWIKTVKGWRTFEAVCSNSNNLQGVFRPDTRGEAAAETVHRALAYERDVHLYIDGQLPAEQVTRSFTVPIYGAFGEAL